MTYKIHASYFEMGLYRYPSTKTEEDTWNIYQNLINSTYLKQKENLNQKLHILHIIHRNLKIETPQKKLS